MEHPTHIALNAQCSGDLIRTALRQDKSEDVECGSIFASQRSLRVNSDSPSGTPGNSTTNKHFPLVEGATAIVAQEQRISESPPQIHTIE
ncbi:hypothetical protein BBK82_07010 [Lentzea guizhouensis]|uniref:Uncharacterized protein n=1 Tax=Lentzea guizhouensis TaxID=1586287 RepID=A0A1B2HDR9_9PSEU|nr:hypothetical protein [Lentzea guizhouensis]ANZ35869.1 hypothetical protein BBK82_07010 [Lentzea guizhouensis]